MSLMFSVPIDRRIVVGEMPAASSSLSVSCECVVDAGWMTRLFTSATFASRLNSFRLSVNLQAVSAVPLISNVKMEAAPLG